MTIKKKPMKEGGATIADRFRLDTPAEQPKSSGGPATTVALTAALIAIAVAGFLAFTLYKHWEYLMPV